MSNFPQPLAWDRTAALMAVLALHAAILYGLSHDQMTPAPSEAPTVFGYLVEPPPAPMQVVPQPPAPPVKPEQPRPIKRVKRQQVVASAPSRSPAEPVAAMASAPAHDNVVDAVPAPLSRPAGALQPGNELAVSCPERTPPAYPALSKRFGEEGHVVLQVDLDEQGHVNRAKVVESSGSSRLDEAALAAVRTWRCNPARRAGQPIPTVAMQPFDFVLEEH